MIERRLFLQQLAFGVAGLATSSLIPFHSYGFELPEKWSFEISLAQWSLHKRVLSGEMSTLDFPEITKNEFGLSIVEYVSQLFSDKAKDSVFIKTLKNRCEDNGVRSHLIMIDNEGSLACQNTKERKTAVENHFKWLDAAHTLGCTSVRVNLHGHDYKTEKDWVKASVESLLQLSEYAKGANLNVLVENHGGISSKGKLIAQVMKKVNLENCGTLPDFGNFCIARRDGDMWESPCIEQYDNYLGISEMLPFAKGISAKTFDFDENGNETTLDYTRLFNSIKNAGFKGIVGIEYEGNTLSETDGIKATIALLEKTQKIVTK